MNITEYVEAIIPIVRILRAEKQRNPRGYKRWHLWYLYRQSFYGFIEFLDPQSHRKVSRRAQEEFSALGIPGNLREKTWNDQPAFDPNRAIFHLEHTYTGDAFRRDIDGLRDNEITVDRIVNLVQTKYFVAWILVEENNQLNQLGFVHNRPEDPFEAYRQAGIQLLD